MLFTEEHHQKFLRVLDASDEKVEFVGAWLETRQNQVTLLAHGRAPTPSRWAEFSDDGDLTFTTPDGVTYLAEVKGTWRSFYDQWPFQNFLVCQKSQFDRKHPPPDFYFVPSHDRRAIASTACIHRADWTVRPVRHFITGEMEDTYFTPLRHVRFFQLV